jgi:hypothetical protein
MYYMGFTYRESYNIPIKYRVWFIERCGKEISKSNDKNQPAHNTHQSAEERAMVGRAREQVPSRLRRFT